MKLPHTKLDIAVLGTGSWGCALALLLARNDQNVRLWGFDPQEVQEIVDTGRHDRYLPGVPFPSNIHASSDLTAVLRDVMDVLIVVPSHGFRATLQAMKPHLSAKTRIAWATKGFDPKTGQLLHQVVLDELGNTLPIAALSGPTFAKEVAVGMPTSIVVATTNDEFAGDLRERLHNPLFHVHLSTDVIGVQIGGAVKNVLAIAVGISDGLGYGANARCALITQGLAEMTRFGLALGAQQETMTGLSGLGDLILTCTDDQSRNRRFGLALAKDSTVVSHPEQAIGQVVEGARNTDEVYQWAKRLGVDMPITERVYRILHENVAPAAAIGSLFE